MHRFLALSLFVFALHVSVAHSQDSDVDAIREKLEELSPLVGKFEISMDYQGEQEKGVMELEWIHNKHALRFYVELGELRNHSTIGWDPEKKAIVALGFLDEMKIDSVWDRFGDSVIVIRNNQVDFKFDINEDGNLAGENALGAKFVFKRIDGK